MTNEDLHRELSSWVQEVSGALGVDPALDPDRLTALLDIASVAAHHVVRPAAPVTTYLVGLAMALDPTLTVDEALRRIERLAGSES